MTSRPKYRPSPSGQPASSYLVANPKAARVIATALAIQMERCVGELTWASKGRKIGDRCLRRSFKLENHRCPQHCKQHNDPRYPTRNSYLRRVPNPSQMEAGLDVSQTEASTPVDTPSRTTASAESSQSSTPQQPTSSNPQPQTSPKQPDRRRHAMSESPGSTPVHTNTSTQASTAVSAPNRSLQSNNLPTPPATVIQRPSEQPNRQRHVTPEAPRRMSLQIPTTTQASLSPPPASVRRLSDDAILALYNQPPNPASPAINGTLRLSGQFQNGTSAPNPSHLTSRPNHDDTSRATSANSEDSDRSHHHTPRPPTPTLNDQAGASSQPSDSASLRTHIHSSTNTPTPTSTFSIVSEKVGHYNSLHRSPSYRSDRSKRRAIEKDLFHLLYRLQRAGECPNAEPLGQDWIDIEPTSVPSIPSSIPEPEGGPSIIDIIADIIYFESPDEDPEEYAMGLLRDGCDESERGGHFRRGLRRRGLRRRGLRSRGE